MARRKRLLGLDTLNKGNELLDLGVPMSKLHLRLNLDSYWSYQSTSDIFAADRAGLHSVTRPDWLMSSPTMQETPEDWCFEGTFPYGDWRQITIQDRSVERAEARRLRQTIVRKETRQKQLKNEVRDLREKAVSNTSAEDTTSTNAIARL